MTRKLTTVSQVLNYLESKGLTFRNANSGSFYCNERRVRVSDHYSKYVERMESTFGDDTAVDIVITFNSPGYTTSDIDELLNPKKDWFLGFEKGCKVEHIMKDRVGDVEFVSVDLEKELVYVKKSDGTTVGYGKNFIKLI